MTAASSWGAVHDTPFQNPQGALAAAYSPSSSRWLIVATKSSQVQGLWVEASTGEPDADGPKMIYEGTFPPGHVAWVGWDKDQFVGTVGTILGGGCGTGETPFLINEAKDISFSACVGVQRSHELFADQLLHTSGQHPYSLELFSQKYLAGFDAGGPEGARGIVGYDGERGVFAYVQGGNVVYQRLTPALLPVDTATIPTTAEDAVMIARGSEDTAVLLMKGTSLHLLSRSGKDASMPPALVLGGSRQIPRVSPFHTSSATLLWDGSSYVIFDLHDAGSFQEIRRTAVLCKPAP
jgi:hypothetical protein